MTDRIEALLEQMTLEEKAQLTSGADFWRTRALPRLGIPALKVSDGPSGARGSRFAGGPSSALFPCGTALGATWDPELAYEIGRALADETRSKGARVLLGPTVNLHRSPLGGRNFECFSEDPELTAQVASGWIRGLQSRGVSACVKHYVCNDSEFERHTISSDVSERALRELYLRPFEAAVGEAGSWSIMSAYNKINGVHASEHRELLVDVLKREWGFEGAVISDWFGTNGTASSARGGLDLEMPGPGVHLGAKLAEAVHKGEADEADVTEMARRLLRLMERTGLLDDPGEAEERADDRPEHRALARRAAAASIVLLRNEADTLPLAPTLRRLAVVGPNADYTSFQGGGSARVTPHYVTPILDAVRERAGEGVEVTFEPGCRSWQRLPVLDERWLVPHSRFEIDYHADLDLGGEIVAHEDALRAERLWLDTIPDGVERGRFSARLRGMIRVPRAGRYRLSLTSAGRSRLFVDGQPVVDNWTKQERGTAFFGMGSTEVVGEVALEAGRDVEIVAEYSRQDAPVAAAMVVGMAEVLPDDALERAERAARGADAVICVVGLDGDQETEGRDRDDMELPGDQVELIERVTAANPRTTVVLNCGSPVHTHWAPRCGALVAAWFGGQEAGRALADVLFGDVDPAGRMPTTWPLHYRDHPALLNYPGENGRVLYGEDVFAGYRAYDARGVEPRFAFGHGLSYAEFDYGALELSAAEIAPDGSLRAEIEVRNRGRRPGRETVQLYVSDPESSWARPPQELRAFARIDLEAGETRRVSFDLGPRAFACWDPRAGQWSVEPGAYEVRVGRSSRDIRSRATLSVAG